MVDLRSELASIEAELGDSEVIESPRKRSESILSVLDRTSPDLISVLSPSGEIVFATEACRLILGVDPNDYLGTSAFDWIHPDDLARVHDERWLEGAGAAAIEYRMRRSDGTWVWVETRTATDAKRAGDLVCITRDITTRVSLEKHLNQKKILQDAVSLVSPVAIVALDEEGGALSCIGALFGVEGISMFRRLRTDHNAVAAATLAALEGTDSTIMFEWRSRQLEGRFLSLQGQVVGSIRAVCLFLEPKMAA